MTTNPTEVEDVKDSCFLCLATPEERPILSRVLYDQEVSICISCENERVWSVIQRGDGKAEG